MLGGVEGELGVLGVVKHVCIDEATYRRRGGRSVLVDV